MPSHFVRQHYARYTPADQAVWNQLFSRLRPLWQRYAASSFLRGLDALHLDESRIPRLEEINQRLRPLTGFEAYAVDGYVPASEFFDCLRRRRFPTTITIRPADQLDYLPEPDIFHDVAGHVPLHTDPAFASALVRFGECAAQASEHSEALSRFFWFTVEFGLIRENGELKAYGSGLLSSHGELRHALESPDVDRRPLRLDDVVRQPFDIDHYQPVLYVADSFEQVYELAGNLRDSIAV